ncbi:MAG: YfhO family protein [Acidobacteria bacterium]|nr:YfhO family protein [Acidobacteriota bacterium]
MKAPLSRVHSGWRRELPLALVLSGILLWLWPAVFGQSTLFYRDLYVQYMGTARLLAGETPAGTNLLWDPLLNGGQPLLGNPNRFVLYPTHLVYRLTGAVTGLNLEILLHFLLGACGMYLLARRVGPGPWAAAVGALAWSLGGISISLANHLGRFLAFAWMPWAILAVELMVRGKRRNRWWLALTVILALQWLTGGFEVILITSAMAVGWAAVRRERTSGAPGWIQTVVAIVVAPLLAAVQVLPAAAMVLRSGRAGLQGSASILDWSVHPLRLVALLVPGFFGPVDVAEVTGRYWGERLVDGGIPYFLTLYLGISVIVLAMRGARSGDRKLARFLTAVAGLGIVLALGRYVPGVQWLTGTFHRLFIVRFPVKATIMLALPVALLAGLGAWALTSGTRRSRQRWWLLSGAGAALAAAGWLALTVAPHASGRLLTAYFGESVPGMAPGVAAALAHVAFVLGGLTWILAVPARRWRAPAMAVLVAADLGLAASGPLPRGPRWMLASPPPIVAKVRAVAGSGRFFRAPDPVPMPLHVPADRAWGSAVAHLSMLDRYLGASYGIPMIFHPDDAKLASARYAALAARVASMPLDRLGPVLELANVRAVLAPGPVEAPWLGSSSDVATRAVIKLTLAATAFPHGLAWFVAGAARVASAAAATDAVCREGFDPRTEAFVEPTPGWPHLGFGPSTVIGRCEIDAPGRGWAVISIPWAPGMVARVDGARRDLRLADGPFLALPVGAGHHRLEVIYRPPEVAAGIAISGLTLLGLVAAFGLKRRTAAG